MSEPAEKRTVSDGKKLGLGCKIIVTLLALVTAAFALGALISIRAQRVLTERIRAEQQERIDRTRRALEVVAQYCCRRRYRPPGVIPLPLKFFIQLDHQEGTLEERFAAGGARTVGTVKGDGHELVQDAWGHPIRLVVPGYIHREGWDLYSLGPNGLDEYGEGDDILIGENCPTPPRAIPDLPFVEPRHDEFLPAARRGSGTAEDEDLSSIQSDTQASQGK